MVVKAVVFDFGGVLLSYGHLSGVWGDMDQRNNLPRGTVAKVTKGLEFSEWLGRDKSLFHGRISIEEVEEGGYYTKFINEMFGTSIKENLKPLSPALGVDAPHEYNPLLCSVLDQLRGFGLKSALLTNNCHIDEKRKYPRLPYDLTVFDVVVESCMEDTAKPEPEIYNLAVQRLGLQPQELVFLDDLKENCDAAVNLGWHAIHVNPANEIAAVQELEKLLGVQFQF